METIQQLKPMCLETPLARGGQPAAVIALPGGEGYAALADAVRQAVRSATGVSLKIVPEAELDEATWRATTVISLGNLMDSRFAERLYREHYVHADARYPGKGGFVVRTVHNPWGSGANVVFLGGSDLAGVALAVNRFRAIVAECGSGTLPQQLEVAFGETTRDEWFARPPNLEERRASLPRRSTRDLMRKAGDYGFCYSMSGHDGWAVAMRDALFEHRRRPYIGWDDTHMELWYTLIGFDIAEESPAISDEDRLALTRYLREVLRGPEGVNQQTFREALKEEPNAIRHNHAMLPALDAYYGGKYFSKYYGLAETADWLQDAAALFAGQETASKPEEDATAYETTASFPLPVIYALAEPDYRILSNGTAAKAMDRYIGCIDNRMALAGNEDVYTAFPMPLLLMTNYYYRDGRYQWVIDRRRALRRTRDFGKKLRYHIDGLVQPVKPEDAVGVRAYGVEPRFYSHWHGPERIPAAGRFDKVSFGADFDPDRQYLLLDGLTMGSHGHDDANAIIRFTDLDRVFLVDDSYDEGPNLKDHNAVTVIRDGVRSEMPKAAELLAVADLPHTGFSRSVLHDHAGAEWTRSIIWQKDAWFVVVDEVKANQAGRFGMACLWRTLGDGAPEPGGTVRTRQAGAEFVLTGAGGDRTEVSAAAPSFLRLWHDYPHCEPHINVIRQSATRDLAAGGRHAFTNLFYATNDSVPRSYALERASGSWGLVKGDGLLVGHADGTVRMFGTGGAERWRYDLGAKVTTLHVAQTAGERLLLAGSSESDLCVLAEDGTERWRIRIPHLDPALAYRAPSRSNDVGGICLGTDADGRPRILAGVANGWLRCFDADGKQLWQEFGNARAFDQIRFAAIGDEGEKVFVVAGRPSHFGDCQVFTVDGERIGRNGLDGWARATNRMEADGVSGTVVCGTELGNLYMLEGRRLRRSWMKMLGDAVEDVAMWAPSQGGDRKVLAASACGYAYQLAASGEIDWATDLGAPARVVRGLKGTKRPSVAVATEDGRVYTLDAVAGKPLTRTELPSEVVRLETLDLDGDGSEEIVAGLTDGSVMALGARD